MRRCSRSSQGNGGRTHLVSPAMAAAAAVTGTLTDVRKLSPTPAGGALDSRTFLIPVSHPPPPPPLLPVCVPFQCDCFSTSHSIPIFFSSISLTSLR